MSTGGEGEETLEVSERGCSLYLLGVKMSDLISFRV